jgi:hypothetical protein
MRIKFLGVFDTVGALGIPLGWAGNWANLGDRFHDTKLGSAIDYAFHAISIDEHRGPFVPALWAAPDHNNNLCVEQVWFPGVHSDVGGGFKIEHGKDMDAISEISLHWMISRLCDLTKIAIAMPEKPLLKKPAKPHDYFGWFMYSRWKPTYRLIKETPLSHRLKRRHFSYTLPPPDHPYKEYLHASALDLLAADPEYRSPNLLSVLKRLLESGPVPVVGYDGEELPGELGRRLESDEKFRRILDVL